MPIEIEAPDGSIVEFPDGTDNATIESAMQAEFAPKTSRIGAAAAGVGQGLTFGLSDEMLAGVGGAYDYLTGGGPGYEQRLAGQREYLRAAREENPLAYYGGEIGGSVLFPAGAAARGAARGASMLGQMARGAGTGAASAGAYGFGTSEGGVENRLLGAADAAPVGAIVGGAAPAVIRGGVNALNAARNYVGTTVAPQRAAARAVEDAISVDATRNPRVAMPSGVDDPRMLLDVGETTRALGRQASNLSPEARDMIGEPVSARFEQQADRMLQFLRGRSTSPGNVTQYREQLLQNARRANRANYARAYKAGDRSIMSPEIERLMSSPMFVKAMRNASRKGKNRAVSEGFTAFNPGVRVTKDGQIQFTRGQGVPSYPNLQYWDYVKRELDEMASKSFRKGANDEGGLASGFARDLRTALDNEVPEFAAARGRAAEFFGADNALDAGETFARKIGDYQIEEIEPIVRAMNSAERAAFREGFLSRTMQEIRAAPDRRTVVGKYMASPASRDRVRIALGDDVANELEILMSVETIMDRARNALTGNSTTARQLVELGLGGAVGGVVSGGNIGSIDFWTSALATAGATRLRNRQADRWARQVAQLLRAPIDSPAMERQIRRLGRNRELSERFKQIAIQASAGPTGAVAGEASAVREQ